MPRSVLVFIVCFVGSFARPDDCVGDRPNILWITAEDMSPTLGCYGDPYAVTENLDKLASRSLRYTHAFATAPVCSPSRSCLINGLPATSQGTHQMRSTFPIPPQMSGFPSRLREAGYFTSNNSKTDYNIGDPEKLIAASWDRQGANAHWRMRPKGKPFFSVFNLMTSHQSRTMVWPYEQFREEVQSNLSDREIHDPAKAPVPPYYPDTPVVRKTIARYYDCVTAMDKQVGEILAELRADGLDDETIVFFYSDHGSGMPRHKRALLDSGMRVALLVHVPQKFQSLATAPVGTTNRLVNFADFGPTVLNIAGVDRPGYMEGIPFLGPKLPAARRSVVGHRDRVDEVFDTARSVRSERYLYIRNFQPHLGYNQPTAYPDLGEVRHEFYAAAEGGVLSPAQSHFMASTRPVEELYDCESDPLNLINLAEIEEHRDLLMSLRDQLREQVVSTRDLGFLPETLEWEWSEGSTPYQMARDQYDVASIFDAANEVGVADASVFIAHLKHPDPAIRFWGAMGFSGTDHLNETAIRALTTALRDTSVCVRIQAADALSRHGITAKAYPVLRETLQLDNLTAVLHAARTIELLGQRAEPLIDAMRDLDEKSKAIRSGDAPAGEKDMAMFIEFSTNAFLTRTAESRSESTD